PPPPAAAGRRDPGAALPAVRGLACDRTSRDRRHGGAADTVLVGGTVGLLSRIVTSDAVNLSLDRFPVWKHFPALSWRLVPATRLPWRCVSTHSCSFVPRVRGRRDKRGDDALLCVDSIRPEIAPVNAVLVT